MDAVLRSGLRSHWNMASKPPLTVAHTMSWARSENTPHITTQLRTLELPRQGNSRSSAALVQCVVVQPPNWQFADLSPLLWHCYLTQLGMKKGLDLTFMGLHGHRDFMCPETSCACADVWGQYPMPVLPESDTSLPGDERRSPSSGRASTSVTTGSCSAPHQLPLVFCRHSYQRVTNMVTVE